MRRGSAYSAHVINESNGATGIVQVDVLVELGLRVSVGPAVLLDAAKGLDAQKPADDVVRARAGALLTQLDALAYEEARGTTSSEHHCCNLNPSLNVPTNACMQVAPDM